MRASRVVIPPSHGSNLIPSRDVITNMNEGAGVDVSIDEYAAIGRPYLNRSAEDLCGVRRRWVSLDNGTSFQRRHPHVRAKHPVERSMIVTTVWAGHSFGSVRVVELARGVRQIPCGTPETTARSNMWVVRHPCGISWVSWATPGGLAIRVLNPLIKWLWQLRARLLQDDLCAAVE